MKVGTVSICIVSILAIASASIAQDSRYRPEHQQIPTPGCLTLKAAWEGGSSPCATNEHEAWLADIRHWRNERKIRIGYDGSRYDLPALKWTQSSFMQPQMMVQDRYFYDPVAGKYTVDRYLDDLEKRYGGIDAVSEFHTQAPASEAWHLVEAAAGEFRLPDTP